MIELDERLLGYERVRAVHAEWSELLLAVERCAQRLDRMGEDNYARALGADYNHLVRRAQLHLRQVASQCAADGVSKTPSRPPEALRGV